MTTQTQKEYAWDWEMRLFEGDECNHQDEYGDQDGDQDEEIERDFDYDWNEYYETGRW